MSITEKEIHCQKLALEEISCHNDNNVLIIVQYNNYCIPVTFRNIINEFELKFNRVPTYIELIKKCEKILNIDLYKIA
jgi:hypothetical protein